MQSEYVLYGIFSCQAIIVDIVDLLWTDIIAFVIIIIIIIMQSMATTYLEYFVGNLQASPFGCTIDLHVAHKYAYPIAACYPYANPIFFVKSDFPVVETHWLTSKSKTCIFINNNRNHLKTEKTSSTSSIWTVWRCRCCWRNTLMNQ
jgi:hypothetical protein